MVVLGRWVGSDWVGLGWVGLGWVGFGWGELGKACAVLCWVGAALGALAAFDRSGD